MCDTVMTAEEIKERKARKKEYDKAYRAANPERFRKQNNERQRRFYAANSERLREESRERMRVYAAENRDKLREYSRTYRAKNREKVRDYGRKYKEANREKSREACRTYHAKNRERVSAGRARYRVSNPEKVSAGKARRRVKLRSNPLNNSTHRLRKFLTDQKVPCHYCNAKWDESFHIDHFLPVSAGAPEADWNLRSSCMPCNLSKGARMPWNFMQSPNLNYYDEQNCTGKTETSKEEKTQTGEETVRAGYTSITLECREGGEACNCNCATNE